ncbi:hypothetical protein FM106_22660 [Brachybacterium faecium]|nr:hypothetical protein FM106_22660 [Brachybacterium faecium]
MGFKCIVTFLILNKHIYDILSLTINYCKTFLLSSITNDYNNTL